MSEWISVEDQLPEEGVVILVYDGYGTHGVQYTLATTSYSNACMSGEEHSEALRGITHWMPLPQPPESEQ